MYENSLAKSSRDIKRNIICENLSTEDIAQLDKNRMVDCWVMALPNGVCRPCTETPIKFRRVATRTALLSISSPTIDFDGLQSLPNALRFVVYPDEQSGLLCYCGPASNSIPQ